MRQNGLAPHFYSEFSYLSSVGSLSSVSSTASAYERVFINDSSGDRSKKIPKVSLKGSSVQQGNDTAGDTAELAASDWEMETGSNATRANSLAMWCLEARRYGQKLEGVMDRRTDGKTLFQRCFVARDAEAVDFCAASAFALP